jgi:hypothetical protein
MVGWGRRALRAELSIQTPEAHVHAIERMCALAAEQWPAQKQESSAEKHARQTKK